MIRQEHCCHLQICSYNILVVATHTSDMDLINSSQIFNGFSPSQITLSEIWSKFRNIPLTYHQIKNSLFSSAL